MGKVLDLQKELWSRVATQARRLGTAGRPQLRQAVDDFEASFPDKFSQVRRERFFARLKNRELLLVGDYHPLPRAQLSAAHLTRELAPKIVALEIVPSSFQDALDEWAASDKPACDFLESYSFEKLWPGVPARGYEGLLETAREMSCRLLALDHPHAGTDLQPSFDVRETWMIERLQAHATETCIALIGDLHLAPTRVPAAIGPRAVVIHQNHPPYHFMLQERKISLPAVLQVDSDRYVWQHTHPLLVEESCLATLAGEREMHAASPEELLPTLLARIAQTLGIDSLDAPTVLATYEPDQRELIPLLLDDKTQSDRLLDRLFLQGQALIEKRLVILHLPGSNHMAEAATKWIYEKFTNEPKRSSRELRLWHAIRREAAGFFGSRLVNPMREGKKLGWYEAFLDVQLPWREIEACARRVRETFDGDRMGLADKTLPPEDSPGDLVLTRILGQEIGSRLAQTEDRRHAFDSLLVPLESAKQIEAALATMRSLTGRLTLHDWQAAGDE